MTIDEKVIEEKMEKGEDLTPEEESFVMGVPADVDPGEGDADGKAEEEKDPADPEDKEKEPEKKETKDPDKDVKKPAEEDKTDDPEADKEEKSEVSLKDKIEAELAKPDGQEDLNDFNNREKGMFYEMRAERRKRQQAEEDRDALKFQKIKDEKVRKEAEELAEQDEEFKKELDEILDGDDDDYISKADMKKIVKKIQGNPEKGKNSIEDMNLVYRQQLLRQAEMNGRDIILSRRVKGETELPDWDKVMEIALDIVGNNPAYIKQINEAVLANKNPALAAYELTIADPRFKTLYQPGTAAKAPEKTDKRDEGKENLKKIDANAKKVKTSGAEGGGSESISDGKGKSYTVNELLAMSDGDFRKVPRGVREKFLKSV